MAKILVIDDEAPLAEIVAECLKAEGHDVLICIDPTRAEASALVHKPDLALIDYQMPLKTGVEVLAAFRAHPETAKLPVLFLSGTQAVRFASQVPPDPRVRFLRKPVEKDELILMVAEMLNPDGWSA